MHLEFKLIIGILLCIIIAQGFIIIQTNNQLKEQEQLEKEIDSLVELVELNDKRISLLQELASQVPSLINKVEKFNILLENDKEENNENNN